MVDSQIKEIKDKLDILEVAKSYITNFKKTGSNYFALCPFHHEKTPSFSVNPELGIFKCFGCGESGDVLTFIQKIEKVDFPQALEIAAKRAGVQLKRNYSPKDKKIRKEKEEILKLNSLVTEYYNYILLKHKSGEKGRDYLKKRKIKNAQIDDFKIGYAPSAYDNLLSFLKSKGYKTKQLIQWGVIVTTSGRIYDKFRSRLIFPLIDQHGDIIGFSGRTVLKNTKAPKYLHSPKTLVFNKSKYLFGLFQAKNSIRDKDFVIFTEGQLDVISAQKTKMNNVIASLGTSLTEDQLILSKRYSNNICFCFDNDLAGENALIRATHLAHKNDINVKAILISDAQDADELINKSKNKWIKAIKESEPIVDHMIRRLYKRLDITNLKQKEEFTKIILPLIATIPNNLEINHYIHRISLILNVDEDIIKEELENISADQTNLQNVNTDKISNILKSPINKKENYLLALILQHINYLKISLSVVKTRYILSPNSKRILNKIKKYDKRPFKLKKFLKTLSKDESAFIKNLLLVKLDGYFENEMDFKNEVSEVYRFIKRNYYQNKIKRIKNEIEVAENKNDKSKVESLLSKLVKYTDKVQEESQKKSIYF